MEKSKLVITLFALDDVKIKRFAQFLNSPYFNQRQDTLQLFTIIFNAIHEKTPIPTKECCFQQIYKTPYDDQKFRLLKSYLFRLLEQFIAIQEITADKINTKLYLAKGYRKLNLITAFKKALKKVTQQLKNAPLRNTDYFAHYYQVLWEQHQHITSEKPSEIQFLKETTEHIDHAYLSIQLKHICLLAAHKNVYSADFKIGFLEEILKYVEQSDLLKMPAIATYYYGFLLLTHPDKDTHFQNLKRTLLENGHLFPRQEIRVLYLMAINHAVRSKNLGNTVFFPELKDLYMEGLEKQYLFNEDGYLSRFTYLNIITVGLRMQDHKWVEEIIYTYKMALAKKYRNASFNFNLARLEYARKNYEKALPLLQQSHLQNLLLNLTSKVLLLKIFYELDEIEALNSHVDAFRQFIRRKKILGYYKQKHITFLNYVQKLININPFNKQDKVVFQTMINQEEDLIEKKWLLEQVDDLIN